MISSFILFYINKFNNISISGYLTVWENKEKKKQKSTKKLYTLLQVNKKIFFLSPLFSSGRSIEFSGSSCVSVGVSGFVSLYFLCFDCPLFLCYYIIRFLHTNIDKKMA